MSAAAIVLGYAALVWQAGAWGALAVAVHVGVMLWASSVKLADAAPPRAGGIKPDE